jgi:hypothetical protein
MFLEGRLRNSCRRGGKWGKEVFLEEEGKTHG